MHIDTSGKQLTRSQEPQGPVSLGPTGGGTMPRVIHFEIHADEPERAVRFLQKSQLPHGLAT